MANQAGNKASGNPPVRTGRKARRVAAVCLLSVLAVGLGCLGAGHLPARRGASAAAQQVVGEWMREEIREDSPLLTVFRYSFYANGEGGFSQTDYEYLGTDSNDPRAEYKHNGCWAPCGGSAQYGRYFLSGRRLTLVTEASAQYGASQVYAYDIADVTDSTLTLCAVDDGEHAVYAATYSHETALTFTKEK